LITLRAFNIETASVRESTTNQTTGQIRLQWWRDALDRLYAGDETQDLLKQPVVAMLHILLRRYRLPKELFLDVISARERDLETTEAPQSITQLIDYSEKTQGSLLDLALHTLIVHDHDYTAAFEAARHCGRCIGLSTLLRATPFVAYRGLTYLPNDLLTDVGENVGTLLQALQDKKLTPPLKAVIHEVAKTALNELECASSLLKKCPRDVNKIMLPVLPHKHYLQTLNEYDYEICHPKVIEPSGFAPLSLRLHLRWAAWRGL